MNKRTIIKLNELITTLEKAGELWRAKAHIEVLADLGLEERDTTVDGANGFQAGAITQVVRPNIVVEYWLSQDEYAETLIEMPDVPVSRIEANEYVLDFHILALKRILMDYAPDEVDWKEAEKADTERWKEEKAAADNQPL